MTSMFACYVELKPLTLQKWKLQNTFTNQTHLAHHVPVSGGHIAVTSELPFHLLYQGPFIGCQA